MNRKEFLTNSLTAGAVLTTGTLAVAAPGMHMAMPTAAGQGQSLNARSFGAVGDGVADDSAALQRAFAALKERGALLIPAGTYRVTKSLVVPPQRSAHIRGEGMGATRIVAASKMPTLLRLEAPFASSFFSHMSLDGAGLADIAVHMMGGSYSHLDSLDVMNPRDTGILCGDDRAFGVGGAVGVECMVLNCRITGMRQTKSSDPGSRLGLMIGGNWSDGHFSNLIIKGFTDVGMEVRAASSKLHMVHIYKLPANRYRIALRVSGSFVSVSQCQFDNPSEVAVEVTRDNCVISSCFSSGTKSFSAMGR